MEDFDSGLGFRKFVTPDKGSPKNPTTELPLFAAKREERARGEELLIWSDVLWSQWFKNVFIRNPSL